MMITAIPTQDGKIAGSCELAQRYTLVGGDNAEMEVETLDFEKDANANVVAEALGQRRVARILASEISPTLIGAFEQKGMQVFYGAAGTISDALNLIHLGVLDELVAGCGSCNSGCGDGCGGGCHHG